MIEPGRVAKILLIDSNVYFSKRLGDALKREGFEVLSSTQPAFALTTLEYDTPTAIVCATNMREMGALEIAKIIHADPKNAALPIIALGDGSQRALMEAFQAGCDDYIDRQRQPAVIATHIRNIIISKAEGFQPTQMLAQADTSLSGSLSHHDLPGVLQMLGHAHQTGALHINGGATDAVLFFDAGSITHAECGNLFGDEAVIHIVKSCVAGGSGIYKFVYGTTSAQHTVLRSATDLMLDAMREYDENANSAPAVDTVLQDLMNSNSTLTDLPDENVAVENVAIENPGNTNYANTPAPGDDHPCEHRADSVDHDSIDQLANDRFAEEKFTDADLPAEKAARQSSLEENRAHEGSSEDPIADKRLGQDSSTEEKFSEEKFAEENLADKEAL